MSQGCNSHIRQALELAKQLTILADRGDMAANDDGCSVLYGVIRDCAYKIRKEAEREKQVHEELGTWPQQVNT